MPALESLHYRVAEQLTHRFVHSFCGNVASDGGNNTKGTTATLTVPAFIERFGLRVGGRGSKLS